MILGLHEADHFIRYPSAGRLVDGQYNLPKLRIPLSTVESAIRLYSILYM